MSLKTALSLVIELNSFHLTACRDTKVTRDDASFPLSFIGRELENVFVSENSASLIL